MKVFISTVCAVLFIVAGIYGGSYWKNHSPTNSLQIGVKIGLYNPNATEIVKQDFEVRGSSMQPLITPGKKVTLQENYYNHGQNPMKNGDIIVFENPFTKDRVIKKLMILPGDRVTVDAKTGTIQINGKTFKNSIEETYIFKKNELKWFEIYTRSGIVIPNSYFIFGDNIHNSIDSRNYGPVTIEGILGKVEL